MDKCVLFIILLFFSFVNTQYSSKCNFPVFKSDDGNFMDFRFTFERTSLTYENLETKNLNISSWLEYGLIWRVTKIRSFIDIEFKDPILISSFAINFCAETENENCGENSTTDSVFKFDYKSPHSTGFTRLKPIQYPNGLIELSILSEGLPIEIGFSEILTSHIRVTKNYLLSGVQESNFLIQLELFGCSPLPENVISLNDKIIHYDVAPNFMDYSMNTVQHGWCNDKACSGLTGTLVDGIIVHSSTLTSNSNQLNWGNNSEGRSINLKIFFKENYYFTHFVVHCISSEILKNCIPKTMINEEEHEANKTIYLKGTSHGLFVFTHEGSELDIQLLIPRDVVFTLSEIEVFGEENIRDQEVGESIIQSEFIPIFISSVFFTITLALIIPLLIAVVIICFKIKKRTLYFPIQQEYFKSQQATHNSTTPRDVSRENDEEKFPNSGMITIDANFNQTPISNDSIKRLDTNVLNNMYERIPTISTIQGNIMRDSMKRQNAAKQHLSPTPHLKLPEIPIYSVPNKTKDRITVNRPASHEGYLELKDLSVDESSPAFQPSEDDNPLYDYIRPRSALLPVHSDSNNSIASPIPEYVNSKQQQQQQQQPYINMNNISTAL